MHHSTYPLASSTHHTRRCTPPSPHTPTLTTQKELSMRTRHVESWMHALETARTEHRTAGVSIRLCSPRPSFLHCTAVSPRAPPWIFANKWIAAVPRRHPRTASRAACLNVGMPKEVEGGKARRVSPVPCIAESAGAHLFCG